jgi:hypothetical protein
MFILTYTINLTHFIVKLYRFDNENNYVDQTTIDNVSAHYLESNSAKELFEAFAVLPGVAKTEVCNLSNEPVLVSEVNFE